MYQLQNNTVGRFRAASTCQESVLPAPASRTDDCFQFEFLQRLIDASPSQIAVLDKTGRIIGINRAWRQFAAQTGLREGEYGVHSMYAELRTGAAAASARDRRTIDAGIGRILEGLDIDFRTEHNCTAVAQPLLFSIHAAAFRPPENPEELMVIVSHARLVSETAPPDSLNNEEERLQRLLATTNIVPWESNAETWMFTYVGKQALGLLGYPLEQWYEADFWISHIHPDDRDRAVEECLDLSRKFDQYQFEYRMIARDGRVVWIQDMVSVARRNSDAVTIRGFMIDITERRSAEETLRDLSGRLITAQEEERKRIARELHDDISQRIALMSIELEQVVQLLPPSDDGLAGRVERIKEKALELSTELHRISYKLHPSKLDHLGLAAALNSFCKELAESRGLRIDFRNDGIPANLPRDLTLCIFRIAQEALQNSAKHSGATHMTVVVDKTGDKISLLVSDSGRGFDMNRRKLSYGLGFTSMRERLRLVNGKLAIESDPGRGTQIKVSVPLTIL